MNVDKERLVQELKNLGQIGYEAEKGTTRVAYSDAFYQGRDYVEQLMREAGLAVRIDGVGNLFGTRQHTQPNAKIILIGSHIDSVPGGGIYDGCLGVLAGIECVRAMEREGYEIRHTIEIAAFIEEEGNAVGGTFGSRCFMGKPVTGEELKKAQMYGVLEKEALSARCREEDYDAYLELHIEQGGLLEAEKKQIGVVKGIVGIDRYAAQVTGQANHAGTTPMKLRDDAMEKTTAMLTELYSAARHTEGMVCTVGLLSIDGGAVNVVPGKVSFQVETRCPQREVMQTVIEGWKKENQRKGLVMEQFSSQSETWMDEQLTGMLEEICKERNLAYKKMFSGAGHDAMNTAGLIPTAMVFIPSISGISHNRMEYSNPEDIAAGAQVLYDLIKRVDKKAE